MKKFIALIAIFMCLMTVKTYAIDGELAYKHLTKFSEIGNRVLVTESEKMSRKYIEGYLKQLGYKPKLHKFKVNDYDTSNIEITKKGNDSSFIVIVGAHYDGRIEGCSFDDNASGVSILLELAEYLKNKELPYDIKFVFFGAEEINPLGRGLHGSYDYVESLSDREKRKIKYMINLDTLLSGDKMYVYNMFKDEEPHDYSLELMNTIKTIAQNLEIELNTNTKDNDSMSFTNTKSDYYPFFEAGIPILYFESTNWEAGECDGKTQTEMFGRIIHTPFDNMIFLENFLSDRMKLHLNHYAKLLKEFLIQKI